MLISHKYKFITIDIPKTGTSSLRETMRPLGIIDVIGTPTGSNGFRQHGSAESCMESLRNIDKSFYDYHSFCIIRNPWERYFSFFKYYKEIYEKNTHDISKLSEAAKRQLNYVKSLFDENRDEKQIIKKIIQNKDAQHFYFTKNEEILVNQVAQFQNIELEFNSLLNKVGILTVPKLEHKNKTQKINHKDYYDQELIDMVAEKERIIIEKYNYGF